MLTSIIETSSDVMYDLQNIANERGISTDGIDFDLLSYQTFFKGTIDED
ncbi:hypothetical protein [Sulfuricurvum sp.]|nr:hypothetical protein [Sulfuricurvum sp.]MBD3798678.1 hypothetical protein [Campylobacterota bacterium]MBD3806137.1 hypothetical protein [Sulfuricurvum sp.]